MRHKVPVAVEDIDRFLQATPNHPQQEQQQIDFSDFGLPPSSSWELSSFVSDYESSHQYGVKRNKRGKAYQRQQYSCIADTISVYTVSHRSKPNPTINFFYPTKDWKRSKHSMDRNAIAEEHDFVRPDDSTKVPSLSTGTNCPLSNLSNNFRYIPEESCDSIISVDDGDEDDDDDDGKTANRSFQGPSPGRASKPQEPSAVEELQALMLSVRESSATAKESQDKAQDGSKVCKVESSMEVEYQKEKNSVTVPNLEMVEEPEESYRARYESEGCRGPIRGVSENGFPTVRVNGYSGNVLVTVYLVTECGEPHLHSITGPGSTKTMCKEVTLEGNVSAIQTWIGPEQNMTAVWDSLSVRRIRNWDADKKLRERGDNPAAWKAKKKEARLMFQCTIPQTAERPGYILTCQSRPFMCTAPSGNPEIWWISENESMAKGGKDIAIIGKKFSTGFRVRFYGTDADGSWEAYAEVDRSKSQQGAIVLKVPQYKNLDIDKKVEVLVEVRVGPEKDKRCSESIAFCYKPEEVLKTEGKGPCSYCNSVKNALSHLFGKDSKILPNIEDSNELPSEPESKRPPHKIDDSQSPARVQEVDHKEKRASALASLPDADVQMSDLSKHNYRQQQKGSEQKADSCQVDVGKLLNVAPSKVQSNQRAPNFTDSALVHLLLQGQGVTPNVSVLPASLSTAVNNIMPLGATIPASSMSIPSQAATPQVIGSTQTKLHTGLSMLATPPNVTLLQNNMTKTPQHPVRLCVLNSQSSAPTGALGSVFSSPRIFSSNVATQNISMPVNKTNATGSVNAVSASALNNIKSQEYVVIPAMTIVDGMGQTPVKEESVESRASSAMKQNVYAIQPTIGSSWSLSDKPQMSSNFVQPITTVAPQHTSLVSQKPGLASATSDAILLLQQSPVSSVPVNLSASTSFTGNGSDQLQNQLQGVQLQQQRNSLSSSAYSVSTNNFTPISSNAMIPGLQSNIQGAQFPGLNLNSNISQAILMPQNLISDALRTQNPTLIPSPGVALSIVGSQQGTPNPPITLHNLANVGAVPASHNSWPQQISQQPTNQVIFSSPTSGAQQTDNSQLNFQNVGSQQEFGRIFENSPAIQNLATSQSLFDVATSSYQSINEGLNFPNDMVSSTNDTNIQIASSFSDNSASLNSQGVRETSHEKENVLAHDLNRLSVVGGLMQPVQFQSEPREIPGSMGGFATSFANTSPAMSDPQPMSLTDDTLPEVINDLIKQPPPSSASTVSYQSDAAADGQIPVLCSDKSALGTEQQQQNLADSFLVPQLQNVEKQCESSGSSQFADFSQTAPIDSVNSYIVGEDAMFSGSTYDAMNTSCANTNEWVDSINTTVMQQSAVPSLVSSSTMESSMWAQPAGIGQNQGVVIQSGNNLANDAMTNAGKGSVADNTNFVSDYTEQEAKLGSALYVNSAGSAYTSGNVEQSPHEPAASSNRQLEGQQQSQSVLPQTSYSHVQNQNTLNLDSISSQQQQHGTFYSNQNFDSIVNSLEGTQQYASALTGNVETGIVYQNDGSMTAENKQQMQHPNVSNFSHQNDITLTQSSGNSISTHDTSIVVGTNLKISDQSDLEQAKRELIEDANQFLAKGRLTQREAQTLYASVQQNNGLLLEMYRTSKKDSEGIEKLVETLKHCVKHVT